MAGPPSVVVPDSFRSMPRWWRDEPGRAWLARLPHLVTDQARRWDLVVDGSPRHGSNALVVPVRRGDRPAVLRLSPPGDDVATEAAALRWWDGRGTVRLLDADPAAGALLLERLSLGPTLEAVPMVRAVPVVAGLVRRLAVPAPPDAPSTAEAAASLVAAAEQTWAATGRPIRRSRLDVAVRLAGELAGGTGTTAVNADWHCGQVLAGDREPWLVVDPVLRRGDPEHDLARVLWSRLDELPDDADVRASFDVFVRTADVPAERARAWVVVRSTDYLLWGLAHGLTEDPPRCARLLDLFG